MAVPGGVNIVKYALSEDDDDKALPSGAYSYPRHGTGRRSSRMTAHEISIRLSMKVLVLNM